MSSKYKKTRTNPGRPSICKTKKPPPPPPPGFEDPHYWRLRYHWETMGGPEYRDYNGTASQVSGPDWFGEVTTEHGTLKIQFDWDAGSRSLAAITFDLNDDGIGVLLFGADDTTLPFTSPATVNLTDISLPAGYTVDDAQISTATIT